LLIHARSSSRLKRGCIKNQQDEEGGPTNVLGKTDVISKTWRRDAHRPLTLLSQSNRARRHKIFSPRRRKEPLTSEELVTKHRSMNMQGVQSDRMSQKRKLKLRNDGNLSEIKKKKKCKILRKIHLKCQAKPTSASLEKKSKGSSLRLNQGRS